MNKVLLSIVLIISSILLSNLALYGIRRKTVPGAFAFSILLIGMIFHSLGYAFELLSNTVEMMYFWIRIEYIGVSFYPFLIMLFAREYTDERKLANRYVLRLLITVNIATLVLVNTNSFHLLYYDSVSVDSSLGFNALKLEKGIWYCVQVATLCFSNLYSIVGFTMKWKKSKGDYRKRALFMLVGVTIPMVVFIVYILGLGPAYIDLLPFSYIFMSFLIGVGLFRHDILFLTPITHEMVFNAVDEAVLVTDRKGMIISFNRVSKQFFPSLENIRAGESIHLIRELINYDFELNQEKYEIDDRIYSFKVTEMKSNRGRIYVVNDITESEQTKKQLEILATTDMLTGIYNRRYFMEKFEKSVTGGVFAIIDIDNFKTINDRFGHVEGDKVLSYFGNELKTFFKEHMVCRYGGEEFAMFIQDNDLDKEFIKLDIFRERIAANEHGVRFTFSAGMAKYETDRISNAIVEADKKLYEAKENGRNQIRY
ncbi:histidine kinase N-terminal 7TM domain-containing diguanylate cyclase [Crassaminicella profunda]|uniref:histidine kinase N-terminal 7TM domain-containing diguanylate cyclase n=1 Tax=Crassaminicella profunda TaxID=1286698 RepID=UPI001CA60944|nr:histidine kinase N-terminal 7TM domain-containing protein [Crassaminicella profunda]QZY56917.1 diguanylate cyclase [Crassaminicella profunda]